MLRNMIKVFHHKVELPAKPTILVKCCLVINACVEHAFCISLNLKDYPFSINVGEYAK